jgi:beta-lactamase class A
MSRGITRRHALLWTGGAFVGAPLSRALGTQTSASRSLSNADAESAAISEYERSSGGHIGLYAENIRTGQRLAWRADERFVMCSTFKASLAACVLSRVDRAQDDLNGLIHYGAADMQDWHAPVAQANLARGFLSTREMCKAAVEQSDNTCANLLLTRIGGPAALTAFWRNLGDRVTRLEDSEPLLNRTPPGGVRDTTTPAAMATTLRRLVLGRILSQASRNLLTEWLVGCQTGANRLRAGLPGSWVIGDKTGNNGKDAAGDIAVGWPRADVPIIMCVYTRGGSPSSAQLDSAFAGIGRFIGTRLAAAVT